MLITFLKKMPKNFVFSKIITTFAYTIRTNTNN